MGNTKRNEWLLIIGRWTSKVGDIVFDYVNSILIVSAFTSSSWILSIYQSSQTIISILFNLIGGVIADNAKRKKILVITDILSACICFIASFFVDSIYLAEALIIANMLLAIIFSFSSPAFKAVVREMVDKNRIISYNSISNMGVEVLSMVGPVIGLVLMSHIGGRRALVINALTFFISAVLEMFLVPVYVEKASNVQSRKNNVIKGIIEGFKYLYSDKKILCLIILSAMVNFFLAGYNLIIPYTDVILSDTFQNFYSKALVFQAAGGVLGSFLNSRIPNEIMNKGESLIVCLGFVGIPIIFIPSLISMQNIIVCLVPFAIFGAFLTIFNINFMSYIQAHVNQEYLGRIFSIIFTVAVLFMPVGSIVFSAIGLVNNQYGFSIVGTGIVCLAACSFTFESLYKRGRK